MLKALLYLLKRDYNHRFLQRHYLNSKSMQNNIRIGWFNGFWLMVLLTFGLQVRALWVVVQSNYAGIDWGSLGIGI